MAEVISQLSAFSIFLGIAAIGFLFLLVSLVFGEVFDHLGSDFDHDLDHGPSFFSPRILSVFVTAFGGTGAVASHYGVGVVPASGAGFVSGVVFASIIFLFARFLYGQQASTDVRQIDVVGQNARVIVSIPSGGVGQVRCRVGEELVDKVAKSFDGGAIPENRIVKVEEALGEIVIVRPQ